MLLNICDVINIFVIFIGFNVDVVLEKCRNVGGVMIIRVEIIFFIFLISLKCKYEY